MPRRTLEFIIWLGLVLLTVVLFWKPDLDLWAGGLYFHPEIPSDPWHEQDRGIWLFFYHAAPWMTGALLLGAFTVLALPQLRRYKLYGVYIFLVIALGPGLLVNTVFKPNWGRPRPREVIELGGHVPYRPFYLPDLGGPGKSFPCGHCSVGFSFSVFWWILRDRRRRWAKFALGASTLTGFAMGLGRMAAGGHFLSDVVWAALMTWLVAGVSYYYLFHRKFLMDRLAKLLPQGKRTQQGLIYAFYFLLAISTLLALALATPFQERIHLPGELGKGIYDQGQKMILKEQRSLKLEIEKSSLQVIVNPSLHLPFELRGYAKGFGFPSNKIHQWCQVEAKNSLCFIKREGLFSDYESVLTLEVNPQLLDSLDVLILQGELQDLPLDLPSSFHFQTQQ